MSSQKHNTVSFSVVSAHFAEATETPNEMMIFALCEDSFNKWYLLVRNLSGDDGELRGGEYIFEMIIPSDFPHTPPRFIALTPNGLYTVGEECCISIGKYHVSNYQQTLGMFGFCRELANGLITYKAMAKSGGINLLAGNPVEMKKLAGESREYNLNHNLNIVLQLESSYKGYTRRWFNVPKPPRGKKVRGKKAAELAEKNKDTRNMLERCPDDMRALLSWRGVDLSPGAKLTDDDDLTNNTDS